jgi:hypothetical protein
MTGSFDDSKPVLHSSHDCVQTFPPHHESPSGPTQMSSHPVEPHPKSRVGSEGVRRAADARRTRDAALVCPRPGCGASFTSRHNLRSEYAHLQTAIFHRYHYRVIIDWTASLHSSRTISSEPEEVLLRLWQALLTRKRHASARS